MVNVFAQDLIEYMGEGNTGEVTLSNIKDAFNELYGIEGHEEEVEELWDTFLLFGAALLANRLFEPPSWLLIVGPSSTMKTSILKPYLALEKFGYIKHVSELTRNAFVSGERGAEDIASDIQDRACLYVPEMASFLGIGNEMGRKIMGVLTAFYDGKYVKCSGMAGGTREIRKKVGLIGAITTKMRSVYDERLREAGGRFMTCAMPKLTDDYVNLLLRKNENDFEEKEIKLKQLIGTYMHFKIMGFDRLDKKAFETPENVHDYLKNSAKVMKLGRLDGTIIRINKVLLNMTKGLAWLLDETTTMNMFFARKVVRSFLAYGLPDEIMFVLRKLAYGCNSYDEILNEFTQMYYVTRKLHMIRTLKDLEEVGVIDLGHSRVATSTIKTIHLTDEYKKIVMTLFRGSENNEV